MPIPFADGLRAGEDASWAWPMWTSRPCGLHHPDGLCSIHEAKPRECRWMFACQPQHERNNRRRLARAWARPAARAFMARLRRHEEE
ncbi:MAG: hypothetical protein OEQ75_11370 [Gemmatimonadota bacterium]|nr:hypothetical protein [Gemmatimonadota bacterium]